MDLDTAPSVEEAEDRECDLCGTEGSFVIYDTDKVCTNCGHAPTGGTTTVESDTTTEWGEWLDHRRSEYSGFRGPDRVKFIGGFARAYEFEDDFNL